MRSAIRWSPHSPCRRTEAVLTQPKTLYSASEWLHRLNAAPRHYFDDVPLKSVPSPHRILSAKDKDKVLPYSCPSVGPRADPRVQAVSPQVTLSHPPNSRLPLLSIRTAVIFQAKGRYQIILLGNRNTCVWAACPRLLPENGLAEMRTRDLLDCKQMLYGYATLATITPDLHSNWCYQPR